MTEKTGIIYLQKDKFQLYSPYLSNILEFKFPPEISLDFDLFNKPVFENLLKSFIVNNKIPSGNFMIVISDNASFIKDFTLTQAPSSSSTLESLQDQAKEFIDHIPFEETSGKIYPLANGIRAYGTNKEMYDGIKTALEKQGFIVEMVIPGFIFGPEVNSATVLNINIINIIFQKVDLLKEYNLLIANPIPEDISSKVESEEKDVQTEEVEENKVKEKGEKKNFVLIIGVAIIFLIFAITGIIIYLQFQENPYKPSPKQSVVKPTTAPQAITKDSTVTPVAVENIDVQIVSASQSAAAKSINLALDKYEFKSINLQTQQNLAASSNLLIFSEKVGSEIKSSVTTDIRKIIPNILIQEKNDSLFDIVVIVAN